MTNYTVHNMSGSCSYDACDSCQGLWLDKGELDKLSYQTGDDGDIEYCSKEEVDGPASKHNCPRCNVGLHKVGFLGQEDIVLEKCGNCGGFWLDGGQLQKIDAELAKIYHGNVSNSGFAEFILNAHLPRLAPSIKKQKSSETDFSVPVLPVKHAKFVKKTDDKCPACGCALDAYKAYGMPIKSCPQCHGMLLEKGEIRLLRNKMAAEPMGAGSGEPLRWMNDEINAIEKTHAWATNKACPVCKNCTLVATYFSSSEIVVDWCKNCHGTWLGYEDLEAIRQFQKYELDKMSSEEMKKKVSETVKKIWTDGSESKISELIDAYSSIQALAFVSIYEHPKLAERLIEIGNASPLK